MNVLLTGGTGQLGLELLALNGGKVRLVAPSRTDLDLCNPASIASAVASGPWDAVINAAAYTAVDKAEENVAEAWQLNALAPALLAQETRRRGIPIIHISTDYVFAGDLARPYREDDPVHPQSVYGASKEAGEQAVRTGNPLHMIVRTAWLVSPHRSNFLKTMLRLASERDVIRVVADQTGSPTSATDLAAASLDLLTHLLASREAVAGTYHYVNSGETTWAGFAEEIMKLSHAAGGPSARIEPIRTEDYPTAARRPVHSTLSTAKLERLLGTAPLPWRHAVAEIVRRLVVA